MSATPQPLSPLLKRLWRALPGRRRAQFGLLTLVMFLTSLAEVFSIGAVLPFLGVLVDPERVFAHRYTRPLIDWLNINQPADLLLPLTVIFIIFALLAGSLRLLLLYLTTRLSYSTGADLGTEIYRRTLYQPYAVHAGRNSSKVISGITKKTHHVIFNEIMPLIDLVSASLMLVMVMATLLFIAPVISLSAFVGFALIYVLVTYLTRRQVSRNAQVISTENDYVMKSLQEGLGGIRDVLLNDTQELYCRTYHRSVKKLQVAQGSNQFVQDSPRFAVESLGMVLIALLAYALSQSSAGLTGAIPILGALAMGAQRMLPMLQRCYRAWTSIKGHQKVLADVLELLEQPAPKPGSITPAKPLAFSDSIALSGVNFRYRPELDRVLHDLNFDIKKGTRLGIMGTTGSGKSTLIDLVMGLLDPESGTISIDGAPLTDQNRRNWQRRIAHVPQAIFLADTTIAENVAFGVPPEQIDLARVKQAVAQAQLTDTVEKLPKKYHTKVGERGVRLSGGQRQRLGIARALYKQADVIVFDEATSALDTHTETAVMQAIEHLSPDLTIILIAHRLSTLRGCTHILQLENGRIARTGTYDQLITPEHRAAPIKHPA